MKLQPYAHNQIYCPDCGGECAVIFKRRLIEKYECLGCGYIFTKTVQR